VSEYIIKIPPAHPQQDAFIRSPAKRKVIVAGRRGGKTTGTSMLAADRVLDGRRILQAAPTHDQTEAFWAACKHYFQEPISAGVIRKNETDRLLEFPNGGRIRTKTAWDADSLRGDYADLLILEEFSLMEPSAWGEVGAPMLLDNDGDAVFIFTPKRRNHAHTMYQQAVQDQSGRWAAFHFTSLDNPHLSREALAEITKDMTAEAYRQEILAEFLENQGQVFRNLVACLNAPLTTPDQHKGHRLVMGVDWGKENDSTAISVLCLSCGYEVTKDRFNQIDYVLQRGRLRTIWETWQAQTIIAESNAMGAPIIEVLQSEGLPVQPFQTTATSKPPLIESLVLAFERTECQWQADPVWTSELESYERKASGQTGRSTYSAPEGCHDDTVMARALAWHAASQKPASLSITDNPFYG
jgi:hypothetical protein